MKYIEENSKIWDNRVENNDIWSIPTGGSVLDQYIKSSIATKAVKM